MSEQDNVPQVGQINMVGFIEQMLGAAKAGQINTIGVVVIDNAGNTTPMSLGTRIGDLYIGVSVLQSAILDSIKNPQQQSRILRPMR